MYTVIVTVRRKEDRNLLEKFIHLKKYKYDGSDWNKAGSNMRLFFAPGKQIAQQMCIEMINIFKNTY